MSKGYTAKHFWSVPVDPDDDAPATPNAMVFVNDDWIDFQPPTEAE